MPAQPAPPCVLVIFGAAGDLTRRLLLPALYNLRRARLLPDAFAVIGVARAKKGDEAFRRDAAESIREFAGAEASDSDCRWLVERMSYLQGEFDDPAAYARLAELLARTQKNRTIGGNCLFYLATPPQAFARIVRQLADCGLAR